MEHKSINILKKTIQYGLAIFLLFYAGTYIYDRLKDVQKVHLGINLIVLVVAIATNVIFYILYSQGWMSFLRLIDPNSTTIPQIIRYRIFFISFLSRYLPAGQLFILGSRAEMLKGYGVQRSASLTSILFEQVYMAGGVFMLAGVGILLYPFNYLPLFLANYQILVSIASLALAALMIIIPEKLLYQISKIFDYHLDTEFSGVNDIQKLKLLILFLIANLVQGLAAIIILAAILPSIKLTPTIILLIGISYPLSRVIGQAVTIIPGGLGVREVAFVALLDPLIPVQHLLLTAALMRLMSVLIEIVITTICIYASRGFIVDKEIQTRKQA